MPSILNISEKIRKSIAKYLAIDLTHAQEHYALELARTVSKETLWLDIGCGHQLLPEWALSNEQQKTIVTKAGCLIGLDVDQGLQRNSLLAVKIFGIADAIPFADSSVDLVTANMVLEHLQEPQKVFREIYRVLKPGGYFLAHTPNAQNYLIRIAKSIPEAPKKLIIKLLEDRESEDVFPAYYRANTKAELESLGSSACFDIVQVRCLGSSGSFWRLGPIGWLELSILWLLQKPYFSSYNSVLLAKFKKPLL